MADHSSQFEKDFGYLMPFLDKVAAASRELIDARARQEVSGLIQEEKGRWARIRQLLGGQAPEETTSPERAQDGGAVRISRDSTEGSAATRWAPVTFQYTVGSLRRCE